METPSSYRGIIDGKTIRLASDPGMAHGEEVEVTLRPTSNGGPWGAGLRRAAGALADSWGPEDDKILNQIQQDRQRVASRELPQ